MQRQVPRRIGRRRAVVVACAGLAMLGTGSGMLGAGMLGTGLFDPGIARAASVRYVDDDAGCDGQRPCYQSIQVAVDAADSGDTLSVATGHYTETVLVVDKALIFEGPGVGDPAAPPSADRHAIWSAAPDGLPEVALTVDARSADLGGLRVTGFRFVSSSVGVRLVGRRSGDPVPLPAGLPASTVDTNIVGARIAGNVFTGEGEGAGAPDLRGALVATWTRNLIFEQNVTLGGAAGAVVVGGSGLRLRDNTIDQPTGAGVHLSALGSDLEIARNTIRAPGGRGIEIRDLAGPGLSGRAGGLRVVDNTITDAGAEGIDIAVENGGEIDQVDLQVNRIIGAGLGPAAVAGGDAGAPFGAIALRGTGGVMAGVRILGGHVQGMRRAGGAIGAGIYIERVVAGCDIADVTVVDSGGPGVQLVDLDSVWLHRASIENNAEGVRIVESAATAQGAPADIKLGGFPTQGNVLVSNAGAALVLVNARGSSASTRDVDATYNDWGSAYAPDIEDRVLHRPDDPRLGMVSYLPALGTPRSLALAANPPRLVADGSSESLLTATALDSAGRPAADGTLVVFTAQGGVLSRPGVVAEVEDEAGDLPVQRTGDWGVYESAVFGSFGGSGYLRSGQPGETLTWTFDAPALLVRYGQTVLSAGSFTLRVDGRDLGPVSTLGPRKTWVERVVARDLGAGPHTVELVVQTGEINVDRFAAGTTTDDGRAEARLRSEASIGSGRVSVAAHGADADPAVTTDVPFTAGPPSSLSLVAGASSLAVGGTSTTLSAEARDAQGRPVPDGTEIVFSTDRGTVSPERVPTQNGMAVTVFTSGIETGVATIRAQSGNVSASRALTLIAGPPAAITVVAGQSKLPANSVSTTELVITVRDAYGHAVLDGTVVVVMSSLGSLDNVVLATTNGVARARLRTGNIAGDALVKATAGAVNSQATISFEALDIRLVKMAEPKTVVVPGERVTFTLRVDNLSSGSIYELDIKDPLPRGLISPTLLPPAFIPPGPEVETNRGVAAYEFRVDQLRPGQTGIITITAKVDTSLLWGPRNAITNHATAGSAKAAERTPGDNASSADIEIVPGAVVTVTVRGPERLAVGGGTGAVTARVTDRFGNPVANGTSVFFTSDLDTTVFPAVAPTRNGLAETNLTSGTRAGVASVRALSTDDRGGLAYVRISPGPLAALDLTSTEPSLQVGGDTTVFTAHLSDAYGNGIPDERVTFETNLGLLSVTAARTGPTGSVTSTLRSGVRIGAAIVRATSGPFEKVQNLPFVAGAVAQIELSLSPPIAIVGHQVGVVAWLADEFGNPTPGVPVEFLTDIGVMRERRVVTDAEGRAVTTLAALRPGSGLVRASAAGFTETLPLTVERARTYLPFASKGGRLGGRRVP
jgi:hypothetical protein